MKGLVIGYGIILSLFLIYKGCNYTMLEKAKGIVIETSSYNLYSFKSSRGSKIFYPIVKFAGPTTVQTKREFIHKPEEGEFVKDQDWVLKHNNDPKLIDSIQSLLYVDKEYIVDTYYIKEPNGAFFIKNYAPGDRVGVLYSKENPDKACLDSFFSFWLPLPSFYILGLILLLWTGIYLASTQFKN